jgi:hypothetical protein
VFGCHVDNREPRVGACLQGTIANVRIGKDMSVMSAIIGPSRMRRVEAGADWMPGKDETARMQGPALQGAVGYCGS